MNYRTATLAALVVAGILSSSSALAGSNDKGACNPPRHTPPPPPPHHVAPPPHHVAPAPVTYRQMAPLSRKSYHHKRAGRSWQMGYRLPRTVVYQEVVTPQSYYLAPPPRNHRYVRVGNDILLMAIGTGLIVNAVYDIAR